MERKGAREGFTLIEIAIVLIVIGLIVGGILVGRDLVRSSNVRGLVSELEKIKTAVNTFRVKYDCLPGDCSTIGNYFTLDAACPITTAAPALTTTCAGDGNGVLTGYESAFFFEHLSLAKLIDKSIGLPNINSGVSVALPYFTLRTSPYNPPNSYTSRYYGQGTGIANTYDKAGGFAVIGSDFISAVPWSFLAGAVPGNFTNGGYLLGAAGGNTINFVPLMPTLDALAVDTKIDDGTPGRGDVQEFNPITGYGLPAPYCHTSTVAATAKYNISSNGLLCALWIKTGF